MTLDKIDLEPTRKDRRGFLNQPSELKLSAEMMEERLKKVKSPKEMFE